MTHAPDRSRHRRIGLVGGHAHMDVVPVPTNGPPLVTAALEPRLRCRTSREDGDFHRRWRGDASLMSRTKPPTAVWLMSDRWLRRLQGCAS
jgi:hypothetical protein